MGLDQDHGFCELPGCPERAVETLYCMNDQAPPPLLCVSLCGEHMDRCPEPVEEAQRWIHGLRALAEESWEQYVD